MTDERREPQRVHVRWMIRRDMCEVMEIEGQTPDSWPEESIIDVLRQRNCIGMVAETFGEGAGEEVIGFMIYELNKRNLRLLRFAVAESHRRQGVGAQMAERLVSKLRQERRTSICATVRETNLSAQLFFRAMGFRAVRVYREYFVDTGEDGFVCEWRPPVRKLKGESKCRSE